MFNQLYQRFSTSFGIVGTASQNAKQTCTHENTRSAVTNIVTYVKTVSGFTISVKV